MNNITIGLTGGICCIIFLLFKLAGKSTLIKEFEKKGALIIDADKIGHEIYIFFFNYF